MQLQKCNFFFLDIIATKFGADLALRCFSKNFKNHFSKRKILYFVKNLTGMAKQTGLHFTVNEQQINHCIESEFLAAFHTFPMKGSLVFQCLPSDDNTWSFHANS